MSPEAEDPGGRESIARSRIEVPVSDSVMLWQFGPDDAEPLFALIDRNREHLSQFEDTTARKYPDLAAVERSILEPPDPDRLRFGIWDAGHLVGTVNLTPRERGGAVIGYWLGEEYTGMGFATEATAALTEYGREQLGYERIYAGTHPRNGPSIAMLGRSGYARLGRTAETAMFVSDSEPIPENERQSDKEAAVRMGLRKGVAVYHDGLKVMAMHPDGSRRKLAKAENMNRLWLVAVLALEDEPGPEAEWADGIRTGEVYVHPEGQRYRVDYFAEDATGYEQGGELVRKVVYTQLDEGKTRPAGSRYVRELKEFKEVFSRRGDA